MKKQTSRLHLGKVRLQKARVLSYLIDHISLIFNQKCHFLVFPIIFMYGFLSIDFF
jgi:hypothetical protein